MKASSEKRSTRMARNTLLINPNDAAYWLAASSFVDEGDALPNSIGGNDERTLDTSTTAFINPSTRRPRLTPVPPKRIPASKGPPPQGRLPNLPSSTLAPGAMSQPFSSPRKAPPTPVMMEADRQHAIPLSPISPLPSTHMGVSSGLLPPVHLNAHVAPPSPCPSSHPGSSLLHATPTFTATQDSHLSVQSGFSSVDSRQSHVGATIISAFPTPPQRIESRARKLDDSELRRLARPSPSIVQGMQSMNLNQPNPVRLSKPLPRLPALDSVSADSSSMLGSSTSNDDDDDELAYEYSDLQQNYLSCAPKVVHRPMCPYAHHEDATEDLCGCEPVSHLPYAGGIGGMMSTSAPNLLDVVQPSSKKDDKEKTRRDLDTAKNVMYRLSDEIEALKADAQRLHGLPAGPKRTIKWQDEEDEKEKEQEKQENKTWIISPLNKALPTVMHEKERLRSLTPDPSRPILNQLWPAQSLQQSRALTPGHSTGLTIGLMYAANVADVNGQCDSRMPAFSGQRSFDDLRSAQPSLPSTPPFAASRRLISTVRSHDRHQGSRASPTRPSYGAAVHDDPTAHHGRHHRQTSSKSSSASSGAGTTMTQMTNSSTSSHPSSALDYASSVSSSSWSPHTPPQCGVRVQGSGKVTVQQSKKESKTTPFIASKLRTPSPKRHKQDSAFFASAVEPFPIASPLDDGEGSRLSGEGTDARAALPALPLNSTLANAQRRPKHSLAPVRTYYGASPRLAGSSPQPAHGVVDSDFGFAL